MESNKPGYHLGSGVGKLNEVKDLRSSHPVIGEIRSGVELGYKDHCRHIYHRCANCSKCRWVRLKALQQGKQQLCATCSSKVRMLGRCGEAHPQWRGDRWQTPKGYIIIRLEPDNFFYPMARKCGYVFEHRLVMAKALGRNLHSWEIIHHRNGIKSDNQRENLQLVTGIRHFQITMLERRIKLLERRVILLEAENVALSPSRDYR